MGRGGRVKEGRETIRGWLWVSPWVIGFVAFLLLPMGLSAYYSLTDYPLLERPLWVGAENYRRLLSDPVFHGVVLKTLLYAAIFIPLATGLSLAIAALIHAKAGGEHGAKFAQAAVFLPTLVPATASAMVWLWLFNGENGLVNRAMSLIGLPALNWLTDSRLALLAIIIMSLWGVGQMVVVYAAAFRDVPRSLYEAADLDGLNSARQFWNITLPMISPVVLFNVITLTIGTLQVFVIPYVITKATPGGDPRAMYLFAMYMYDKAFVYSEMGYACAMAWIQMVATLLLTGAMFLLSKQAVYYRGG
jgi:multiple sugar transport system permease protein